MRELVLGEKIQDDKFVCKCDICGKEYEYPIDHFTPVYDSALQCNVELTKLGWTVEYNHFTFEAFDCCCKECHNKYIENRRNKNTDEI